MTTLTQTNRNRIHGLDTLRAGAILLVYLYHYSFVAHTDVLGIGWSGVDLFFVLSGYLIGHQIFTDIAHKRNFSARVFMIRRLMRTLPNYLVVLSMYFFIDGFREKPALPLPELWKFLTFTVNFGLKPGVAFSHVWSLCIEEQFYLALPIIALFVWYRKSIKLAWVLVLCAIMGGMFLRGFIWLTYVYNGITPIFASLADPSSDIFNYKSYYTWIYYATFCRLDPILLGVTIAMLRNFHSHTWYKLMERGNILLFLGVIYTALTFFLFTEYHYSLILTIIGYPMLGLSFALLVLAALSPNSLLHKTRVIGAEKLAVLSFAIYLIQKPLQQLAASILINHHILERNNPIMFICTISTSLLGGWLLFTLVETPFLKLRDRLYKKPRL